AHAGRRGHARARCRPAAGTLATRRNWPAPATCSTHGTRTSLLTRLPGHSGSGDIVEVLVGDRIFVFLAEKMPLHEHVHARREGLALRLEESDRANVLVAAEDQLFFLLA